MNKRSDLLNFDFESEIGLNSWPQFELGNYSQIAKIMETKTKLKLYSFYFAPKF